MKLSEREKVRWSFFLNDKEEIQYNAKCNHCTKDCKQSFRATIVYCPLYEDRNKESKKNKR